MRLDRPTRSIRLLKTHTKCEVRLREKHQPLIATNSTNELKISMHDNVYLAAVGRTLLELPFGLIQMIGSTLPKFDV